MYKPLNFWLIGGDHRQAALAHALAEDGHSVHTYALEEGVDPAWVQSSLTGAETAHCVILPLPAAKGDLLNAPLSTHCPPLSQVLDALSPQQLICAGMVTPALTQAAANRSLTLTDYFAREELAVANAVPAALAIWLHNRAAGDASPAAHDSQSRGHCLYNTRKSRK